MRVAIAVVAGCLMFEAACSAVQFPKLVTGPVPTLRSVAQLN